MDSYQPLTESSDTTFEIKTKLNDRIKEVETSLDKGCFYVYQIFILFLISSSLIFLLVSLFFVLTFFVMNGSDAIGEGLILLGLPIYFVWLICQQYIEYKAICDRDLTRAKKAVELLLYLMVFGFVFFLISLGVKSADREVLLSGFPGPVGFMAISIFGACKVQRKLEERQLLIDNLKENGFNSV